jgi:hypothetical protein
MSTRFDTRKCDTPEFQSLLRNYCQKGTSESDLCYKYAQETCHQRIIFDSEFTSFANNIRCVYENCDNYASSECVKRCPS